MLLYLMRHGIAADPDGGPDAIRPLTPKGVRRTRAAAHGLARVVPRIDSLWTSPYLRARQTAELAAEELALPPGRIEEHASLEPDLPPARLLGELQRQRHDALLCVGHLPHLDLVLGELLTGSRTVVGSFRKAAAAAVEWDGGDSPARLLWFLPPRALRLIGHAEDDGDDE